MSADLKFRMGEQKIPFSKFPNFQKVLSEHEFVTTFLNYTAIYIWLQQPLDNWKLCSFKFPPLSQFLLDLLFSERFIIYFSNDSIKSLEISASIGSFNLDINSSAT